MEIRRCAGQQWIAFKSGAKSKNCPLKELNLIGRVVTAGRAWDKYSKMTFI